MKHTLLIVAAVIAVISCNNEPAKNAEITATEDTSKPVENKVMIPESSCYSSVMGKDSFQLKVEVFPNVVTGYLSYIFHDKDSNEGAIEGQLHGDTLIAEYKFMSEGVLSTRQVSFLIKDSVAVEGYGLMEEKEGKMLFKNAKDVTFGKGIQLKKVSCN